MEYLTLNNGINLPLLGYGVFQVDSKTCQQCAEFAFEVGYRLIDTAEIYQNEEAVGAAIQNALKGGIKREELFITTKVWVNHCNETLTLKAFENSLKRLQLDYLDLYLIHMPYHDAYGAWRAMSKLYQEGRIKAIGVSNFDTQRIYDFCTHNAIVPMVNQIECHPFYTRENERKGLEKLGVKLQAWSPFAEGKSGIFTNPILAKIGEKYGKTPAQVILRWLIERGIACIPKTIHKERMQENFSIFDFALSADDIAQITTLDSGKAVILDQNNPQEWQRLNAMKA